MTVIMKKSAYMSNLRESSTLRASVVGIFAALLTSLNLGFFGLIPTKTSTALTAVGHYKNTRLQDISSDGTMILLYESSNLLDYYNLRTSDSNWEPKLTKSDGTLRVVRLNTNEEVARLGIAFSPLHAQFVADSNDVFFVENDANSRTGPLFKLWETKSNKIKACEESNADGVGAARVLDRSVLIASLWKVKQGDILVERSFDDCSKTVLGSVDPENQKHRSWGQFAISPNRRWLVAILYGGKTAVIWDLVDKKVLKRLSANELFLTDLAFLKDGKTLIVLSTPHPFADQNSDESLLFVDTSSYQITRRLNLPEIDQFAVSGDNKFIAISHLDRTRDNKIVLAILDFLTGKQLDQIEYPIQEGVKSTKARGQLGPILFTPDNRFLLAGSSVETRVWRTSL